MTNELRALRLSQLHKIAPRYVQAITGKDYPTEPLDAAWLLKFPSPKTEQVAFIDAVSGELISFYHQAGATVGKVKSPELYLKMVDRRIDYLWTMHKHHLAMAKQTAESAMPTRIKGGAV